jgi:DNA (cytosine-5)-methyltransferase 1
MKLTFIEMFCGIGGFRLGLERSGWKCVWANDIDKYACQVYRRNFGDGELVEGDVRSVDADAIPDHTLLTAGFPCQSFSLAGKRKGFEDARGTLFYDIARVAGAKRPPLLLLENVKGLLSNDGGRTFARILQTLDGLGYDVEWQVLNSKHFGVPQNRERVFVVGHLRGTGSRQIFPVGEAPANAIGAREEAQGEEARLRVANSLNVEGSGRERNLITSALIHSRGLETRNDGVCHSLKGAGGGSSKNFVVANTLSSRYFKDGSENLIKIYDGHHKQFTEEMGTLTGRENRQGTNWLVVADRTRSYANLGRNLESPKSVTNALSGVQKDNLVLAVETAFTKANMKQGRFSKECHSLDGGKSKGVMLLDGHPDGKPRTCLREGRVLDLAFDGVKIRRLTPIECERLQGFPDGWTEGVSDTQRYKLLGNAVTVNVVGFLGELLRGCLQ